MRKFVLFITLLLLSFSSKAAHLVGGEISYKCVGTGTNGNTYQIRLTIYRDCNSSGAPFDMQAPITIYGGPNQNTVVQTVNTQNNRVIGRVK